MQTKTQEIQALNQAEIDAVSGGIIGVVVVVIASVLLGGCATVNGPNNNNLKKDQK